MKIIPAIDLLKGLAVQARGGLRQAYAPLSSSLCPDGAVLPLVRRLTRDLGAECLYLADLDAIQGAPGQTVLLAEILDRHPGLTLWLDAGLRMPRDLERLPASPRLHPVIGSETWTQAGALPPEPRAILSLDRFRDGLRDPSGIAGNPSRWPVDLILMSLPRVGARGGPDLRELEHYVQRHPGHRFHAAGGVRGPEDLRRLRGAGAAGVLLASALHSGAIGAAELSRLGD